MDYHPSTREYLIEHRLGKLTRKRILLAWVKRGDQGNAFSQAGLCRVLECRPRGRMLKQPDRGDRGVKGEAAERYDYPDSCKQFELAQKIRPTVGRLLRQGLVLGRRAPDRRSHVTISQAESVIAIDGSRLIRKTRFV